MGRTACTEPQCLYKGDLCLYLTFYSRQHPRLTALTSNETLRYKRHYYDARSAVRTVQLGQFDAGEVHDEVCVSGHSSPNTIMIIASATADGRKKISYTQHMRNAYKILVREYVRFEIRQGHRVFRKGILWLCTACLLLQHTRYLCDLFQLIRHPTIDARSHTMAAS